MDTKEMPSIPTKGVNPQVRKDAKVLLEQNPHLWSPEQVPAVLRLCSLRQLVTQTENDIREQGVTFTNRFGDLSPNPAISALGTLNNAVIVLERSLCIVFGARERNVKDSELKAPPKAPQGRGRPRRDDSPVHLRLA